MKILKLISRLFYLSAIVSFVLALFLSTPVYAETTTIPWEGNGSENLPCSFGAHWVLSPAQGITGAVLTVNGASYTMAQRANGSWWADSIGALDVGLTASVEFTGVNDKTHLQLSHCLTDPGTVTPTITSTPTEITITPTITLTPTPTDATITVTPTVTGTPTEITVTSTPQQRLPQTGASGTERSPLFSFSLMFLGMGLLTTGASRAIKE